MPKYHLDNSFIKEPVKFHDVHLVQIGRLYFDKGGSMHLHAHKNFYELTIITDGEGEVITNGISTHVRRGDIYLSLPCDMHEIRSAEDSAMKYDFFSFMTDNEAFLSELESITRLLSPTDRVFKDERISALVCNAIMEFVENEKFSEELLYSIFKEIIIYIIRDVSSGTKKASRAASQAEAICYQIMNYVDTHVYTMSGLEEISEIMNYNYSYLSSLFKKTTGNTLLSYYHKKRLEAARLLIMEKNLKITQISEMLGYSSLYAFSRAFKETYGISPKQYEQNEKHN